MYSDAAVHTVVREVQFANWSSVHIKYAAYKPSEWQSIDIFGVRWRPANDTVWMKIHVYCSLARLFLFLLRETDSDACNISPIFDWRAIGHRHGHNAEEKLKRRAEISAVCPSRLTVFVQQSHVLVPVNTFSQIVLYRFGIVCRPHQTIFRL